MVCESTPRTIEDISSPIETQEWVTVLVVGGCGNLGRHMVKLLMERGKGIHEVRVLDYQDKPADFNLVSNGTKLSFLKGDIRNMDDLRRAFKDVTVVVHSAAVIASERKTINEINVKGTENIINACIECNVSKLVYTSSTEISRNIFCSVVSCTEEDIDNRKRENASKILNGYTFSKQIAEDRVRGAEGERLHNGGRLHTVVLRPSGIYGEGDMTIVPKFMKTPQQHCFGFLPSFGPSDVKMSLVYVGNAAWAHVCAVHALMNDAPKVTGRCYNITDDTPITDYFTFVEPFLKSQKIKILHLNLPTLLIYYVMFLLEIITFLLRPVCKFSLPTTKEEVFMVGVSSSYSGTRLRHELNYTPYYSHKEAHQHAYSFYSNLNLMEFEPGFK